MTKFTVNTAVQQEGKMMRLFLSGVGQTYCDSDDYDESMRRHSSLRNLRDSFKKSSSFRTELSQLNHGDNRRLNLARSISDSDLDSSMRTTRTLGKRKTKKAVRSKMAAGTIFEEALAIVEDNDNDSKLHEGNKVREDKKQKAKKRKNERSSSSRSLTYDSTHSKRSTKSSTSVERSRSKQSKGSSKGRLKQRRGEEKKVSCKNSHEATSFKSEKTKKKKCSSSARRSSSSSRKNKLSKEVRPKFKKGENALHLSLTDFGYLDDEDEEHTVATVAETMTGSLMSSPSINSASSLPSSLGSQQQQTDQNPQLPPPQVTVDTTRRRTPKRSTSKKWQSLSVRAKSLGDLHDETSLVTTDSSNSAISTSPCKSSTADVDSEVTQLSDEVSALQAQLYTEKCESEVVIRKLQEQVNELKDETNNSITTTTPPRGFSFGKIQGDLLLANGKIEDNESLIDELKRENEELKKELQGFRLGQQRDDTEEGKNSGDEVASQLAERDETIAFMAVEIRNLKNLIQAQPSVSSRGSGFGLRALFAP